MSEETRRDNEAPGEAPLDNPPNNLIDRRLQPQRDWAPLPGLLAIGLYLLVLAGVIILGVAGRQYPAIFLLLAAAFLTASAGLILLLRWAWAGALAAVFLLACYNLWIFGAQHVAPALVQGLLNLVFFLYLVRAEVREKLR
jgi:hypothetical protein